jgi:hypothetical protein
VRRTHGGNGDVPVKSCNGAGESGLAIDVVNASVDHVKAEHVDQITDDGGVINNQTA